MTCRDDLLPELSGSEAPWPGDAATRPGEGRLDAKTLTALGVTLLSWSSAFAGIGAGLRAYAPGHLVLLRFLVAAGALLLYAVPARTPLPRRRDLPALFLLALLGFTVYHIALVYGQVTVDAGTTALLIATSPAITALVARIILRERLKPLGWAGIAISFVGAALIAFGKSDGMRFAPGALLILLSAFTTSLYNVLQKPYLRRYRASISPPTPSAWCPPDAGLPAGPGDGHRHGPASATLAIVTWASFHWRLATWAGAMRSRAPAAIVSSFLYLSTPLALVIAWIWLGQVPPPSRQPGGGAIARRRHRGQHAAGSMPSAELIHQAAHTRTPRPAAAPRPSLARRRGPFYRSAPVRAARLHHRLVRLKAAVCPHGDHRRGFPRKIEWSQCMGAVDEILHPREASQ